MDVDFGYQVVLNTHYFPHQTNASVSCSGIWDSTHARFERCALPYAASIIPATAIICVLICHVLRLFHKYRPIWLRNFIQDPKWQRQNQAEDVRSCFWGLWILPLVISIVGLIAEAIKLWLVIAFASWEGTNHGEWFIYLPSSVNLVTWAFTTLYLGIRRPKTVSASLVVLFAAIAVAQILLFDVALSEIAIVEAVGAMIGLVVVINMPIREPHARLSFSSPTFQPPTSKLSSPEDNLTLWQWMTVSWMSPLISLGSSRQLNEDDVWSLSYQFEHKTLHNMFRDLRGSVISRLFQANGVDLIITTLLDILEMCAELSLPLLLQKLLGSMENPLSPTIASVKYAAVTLLVRFIGTQSAVFNLWFCRRAYERSRGELITMLHEKTLSRKIVGAILEVQPDEEEDEASMNGAPIQQKSSNYSRMPWRRLGIWPFGRRAWKRRPKAEEPKEPANKGKILNILRNDAYEIAQRFWEFPKLITTPLRVILSVVLVWAFIGWPCLIGIATVIIGQTVNGLIAKALLRLEKIRRIATDKKLQKISQVVESIRHLRWYAWQDSWLKQIMDARQYELKYRVINSLLRAAIAFMNTLSSGMFPVAAFWGYTALAGKELRIDIAFPALELFGILQGSLREVPNLVTVLLNASVAMGRINDFMNEPDLLDDVDDYYESQIKLNNVSFSWPGFHREVLQDITLSFPIGLTVICGKVGCGKTALLQAVLGELDKQSGEVIRHSETMGYCAQNPWLQSMSIRDNILFSSPYEESRYTQVIDACALIPDLATFKYGDLTNIGENGIGLSGGQKARVALARALYSNTKVLLLDDPISALDYQTSEYVVRKCFGGPLTEGRIVILATHRVELCRDWAEQVVEISQGRAKVVPSGITDPTNLKFMQATTSEGNKTDETGEEDELAALPEKFIEDEHRAHGGVRASIYWRYIKAGKLRWWLILIIVLAMVRFFAVAKAWFVKAWGEAYDEANTQLFSGLLSWLPSPETNIRPWLLGFFSLVAFQSIVFLVAQIVMVVIVYVSGRQLFAQVMHRVCNATFRYYEVTPVGRLMNRVTSDINTIDGNISQQFHDLSWFGISWISAIVVIAGATPLFLIFSAILTAAFVLIFRRFLPTSQSLRRLEMVSLSPLMSSFGVLLDGLMTVRAFCAQPRFQDRVIAVTDAFQKQDHFYWSLQAWLMYRLDLLSAFSTFILTLLAIYTGVTSGLTAFVLIAANRFVNSTHSLCQKYGKLQMDFVSVERVVELLDLEQEPEGTQDPPAWWPSYSGDIVFDHVSIRYASANEPALSDISIKIKGGSTTAIVGRTGSGKSTLALALLATISPEAGHILVDGIDISQVNKQALRSRVTFLAQEPVLFPGSMRQNLDPLEEHSDESCNRVLQKVCGTHSWTLATQLDGGGKNLSQGQRQLVGLARAILRRSPIIILDEATASIDMATSTRIQEILREELAESTVVTIAHRLEAVRNADYCITLSKGCVQQQGAASKMLTDT